MAFYAKMGWEHGEKCLCRREDVASREDLNSSFSPSNWDLPYDRHEMDNGKSFKALGDV